MDVGLIKHLNESADLDFDKTTTAKPKSVRLTHSEAN